MTADFFWPPRNFGAIAPELADFDKARVLILPVPYDGTTTLKSGARDGPQAVIDASQDLELYDLELGREICAVGIHTLRELAPVMSGPEAMVARVREVARELLATGKLVVMLGGEHSLTLGMVQALLERFPSLSVLQLDAQADLRDEYLGSRFGHASVARRILELCPLVQVGVRSLSLEEADFLAQGQRHPFYAWEVLTQPDCVKRIVEALGQEVYVTIDLDVFDPSVMAAVGTPEPGGLGWYDALRLLRAVAQRRRIVGFDVVELSPREGPFACAQLAASLVYKLIGYVTLDAAPS